MAFHRHRSGIHRIAFSCIAGAAAWTMPPGYAQSPKQDYAKAYGYALKCFVAGGVALPKPEDDRNGTATRTVHDHARKAFDTVNFMGEKLGYSPRRIASDLDHAQAMEMRLMVQNAAYFEQTKSDCVKLGLM